MLIILAQLKIIMLSVWTLSTDIILTFITFMIIISDFFFAMITVKLFLSVIIVFAIAQFSIMSIWTFLFIYLGTFKTVIIFTTRTRPTKIIPIFVNLFSLTDITLITSDPINSPILHLMSF